MSEPVRYVMNDGVTVVGDFWPAESSCVVLLLHGGGQTRHSWKRAGQNLSAAGIATVAVDARGHGDSEWSPQGIYSRARMADDIVAIAGAIGRPIVLVGASMGGLAALLASATLQGDRLLGLVLVDVVPNYEAAGGQRVFDFMGANLDGFATVDEAAEAIADYIPHRPGGRASPGLEKNLRLVGERWFWHWDPVFLSAAQEQGGSATRDDPTLQRVARELTTPVMLLRGALSDVVSEDAVQSFLKSTPHAEVTELAAAAHTAAADSNDAFNAAVMDFVHRLVSTGPATTD